MGKSLEGKELGTGITQRKDGVFEARATIGGQRIDIYSKNLSKLKREFNEAKEEAYKNKGIRGRRRTLDAWYEEWFRVYKAPTLKEASVHGLYRKYYLVFSPTIGYVDLREVTNKDIQNALNDAANRGVALSTIKHASWTLAQCLESASNNSLILKNPCFDLLMPKNAKVKETEEKCKYITQEQQDEFLMRVKGHFYDELICIMFLTGLRIGEVGALTWEDVNFTEKYIEVSKTLTYINGNEKENWRLSSPKTKSAYRRIPFMGEAEEFLCKQMESQRALKKHLEADSKLPKNYPNFVFTTKLGTPVTEWVVGRYMRRVVDAINKEREFYVGKVPYVEMFPLITPHTIRHVFCSRCFECGMSPKTIQMIMGHSQYSVTVDTYTHLSEDTIQYEAEKFRNIRNK